MPDIRRRDKKNRILRNNESIRADGRYQFKYMIGNKAHFVYSWRLEPTDPVPKGKRACKSLRELEVELGKDINAELDYMSSKITVCELVEKYVKTKVGVKQSTKWGYNTVRRILEKEEFGHKIIRNIKTSDAKLFLIKLQQEDKRHYSAIHSIRGVLRPAFQMAVDDDILLKNPFNFQLAAVLINDSVAREAVTPAQMRQFLKFVKDDNCYYKYYEVVYILFHTGLRISEFCGLTLKDIDLVNRTINVDKQLVRLVDMCYHVETTKTKAGVRKLPMTEDVYKCFKNIVEDRVAPEIERIIDGYSGFLFLDKKGMPEVAMHWQHRFKHMVNRYNDIYKIQMPKITPHVCRHTYCTQMAKSGVSPKTLQYLMGHTDISVTLNVYTHVKFEDAEKEIEKMQDKLNLAKEELDLQSNVVDIRQFKMSNK